MGYRGFGNSPFTSLVVTSAALDGSFTDISLHVFRRIHPVGSNSNIEDGNVPLTSPLAFLFVEREHYVEYMHRNDKRFSLHVEMNKLVALLVCALT